VADATVVVCLDVASPAIRCIELPLNNDRGSSRPGVSVASLPGSVAVKLHDIHVVCYGLLPVGGMGVLAS
jgi:hypothetical protein